MTLTFEKAGGESNRGRRINADGRADHALMRIGTPFEEGQCLQVTLHFVNAGDMPVVLSIGGVAQSGPPMDHDMSGMSSMEGM